MDYYQAPALSSLPFIPTIHPLSAQAYSLQEIFHTYVKAHHGRLGFRDEAWKSTPPGKDQHASNLLDGRYQNAAKAVSSYCKTAGLLDFLYTAPSFLPINHTHFYTNSAFFYLLWALYQGTLSGKISAENCARQLGWLSQIPTQAEVVFEHTYDVKWFTKHKALRGTMLFVGDEVGNALADEAERLLRGIAACKSIRVLDAPSVLREGDNSMFMAFVLSRSDCSWTVPLFELAKEKGVCAVAVTMRSLQNDVLPYTDVCLPFPTVEPIALPVLGIMPVQVFANDIALTKGLRAHSMLQ